MGIRTEIKSTLCLRVAQQLFPSRVLPVNSMLAAAVINVLFEQTTGGHVLFNELSLWFVLDF